MYSMCTHTLCSVAIYVNCKYVKSIIKYHYHMCTVQYPVMESTIHDIIHLYLCCESISSNGMHFVCMYLCYINLIIYLDCLY